MNSVFDWKVIHARLSRSQALTHLAALSIVMEPVAMAAEKVLTATQQARRALGATTRARLCLFVFFFFYCVLTFLSIHACVCVLHE